MKILKSFLFTLAMIAVGQVFATNVPSSLPSEATSSSCAISVYKNYGGTASVRVQNKDTGETRVINVAEDCNWSTSSMARVSLKRLINSKRHYYEKMISSISYSIDSCER